MKKIVLTGATGGIGQAVAHYLSDNYELILSSRNAKSLARLKEALTVKPSARVDYQVTDYSNDRVAEHYKAFLKAKNTNIDGLVIITPKPIVKTNLFPSPPDWEQLFSTTFIGPLAVIQSTIPYLRNAGKIVIVSGISSCQYMPGKSAFSVLRAMWLAQAKALAYELGPGGISVNTISPGGVMTPKSIKKMKKKAKDNQYSFEKQYEHAVSNVPLRKYAKPEEIAAIIAFFLSEQSNHITGTNLVCDGGFNRCYT